MKTKVFSTSNPVKPKRRRIGQFTDEIKAYKASLDAWQLVRLENRINNLIKA